MLKYFSILFLLISNFIFSQNNEYPFTGKVNANKVRIRTEPNLESAIIEELSKNELLLVENIKNDFYVIRPPQNSKLYISKNYVKDNIVIADNVNVRLKPSLESTIVGTINKNQKVEGSVSTVSNQWLEITPPETINFYISKDYVTKIGDESSYFILIKRKEEVNQLLNSAFFLTQMECKKPFNDMKPEKAISQFEAIIKGYSDFSDHVKQAKEGLALLKDTYLQKKIAYLESKMTLSSNEKDKIFKEVISTKDNSKPKSKPISKNIISKNLTDKMKKWLKEEKDIYLSWNTYYPNKSIEDFYDEQKANAITLNGVIVNYDDPVKNKPGNYLLKGETIPIAYLYSTIVDLEKYLGKKVNIIVSPRPNNNFAFPAYFVNSVKVE
ncbi:MAG: hypothetical protein AMS24_00795 [Chlamydiae bacterium SM23_39]|nr:MAG: hypothetical protein AMS24_00795 [Chlamydiae bacterium SM23_39]